MLATKERVTCLVLSVLFTGCAISPDASKLASQNQWEMLGYEDGRLGNHSRTEIELQQLIIAAGKAVNEYEVGYSSGLAYFCETENAYIEGVTGRPYDGQCKNRPNEEEYIAHWHLGADQYEFEVLDRLWQETASDHYESLMEEYALEMTQ